MKQYLLTLCLFFVLTKSFCQGASSKMYNTSDYYYKKTDFTFIDTVENWSYDLTFSSKSIWSDSVTKPIAEIVFFRTKPLYHKTSKRIDGNGWTPEIEFEIYYINDLVKCFKRSEFTRHSSSCVPPAVGGDMFTIGNFIFLNNAVCLNCSKSEKHIDYCRPTIKYIFSKVKPDKISSLKEIVEQFNIKPGKPKRQ